MHRKTHPRARRFWLLLGGALLLLAACGGRRGGGAGMVPDGATLMPPPGGSGSYAGLCREIVSAGCGSCRLNNLTGALIACIATVDGGGGLDLGGECADVLSCPSSGGEVTIGDCACAQAAIDRLPPDRRATVEAIVTCVRSQLASVCP